VTLEAADVAACQAIIRTVAQVLPAVFIRTVAQVLPAACCHSLYKRLVSGSQTGLQAIDQHRLNRLINRSIHHFNPMNEKSSGLI